MADAPSSAVFLSYASQDAGAVRRIAEALRAAGVEVWFDQNELVGGDAWDAKIRGQIAACALFVPVISGATQARHEGYFRLEWKLAAQRTHMMSGAKAFLLPVVIDETRDAEAHVPAEFRAVQWTRLPGGEGAAVEKFCARVGQLLGGSAVLQPALEESERGLKRRATPEVGRRVPVAAWGIAVAVVACGVGGYAWLKRSAEAAPIAAQNAGAGTRPPTAEKAATVVSEKSLVVLPLENLSPDPENAFFTDGMHIEITATLGQIADLKVIPRQTALAFKGSTAPLAEIAQKLGVANVVTGSVRRAGNTVRVQLELRRASDEALLWSLPLPKGDRDLKDVLGLQSEIAEQVATVLKAREGKGVSAAAQLMTKDAEAYDLYLKATMLYVSDSRDRESNSRRMVVWLEEALRRDPNFMPAAKWLARAHGRIAQVTKDPVVRVREAAECKKWAETTARMMPGGGGDGALAHYYQLIERDFAKALIYGENSIRALPGDQDGYNFAGLALDGMGRGQEALVYLRKGAQLETRYLANWGNVLGVAAKMRRCDVWDEVTKELPSDWEKIVGSRVRRSRFLLTGEMPTNLEGMAPLEKINWLWHTRRFDEQARLLAEENQKADGEIDRLDRLVPLADALNRLGRKDEAAACARQALTIAERLQSVPEVGASEKAGWLAPPLARLGRDEEAIAAAKRYVEAAGPNRIRTQRERQVQLAELYAYLKRPRECVELLAILLRVPSEISVPMLKVDPAWDNVREDAGFKALLADPKNSAPL